MSGPHETQERRGWQGLRTAQAVRHYLANDSAERRDGIRDGDALCQDHQQLCGHGVQHSESAGQRAEHRAGHRAERLAVPKRRFALAVAVGISAAVRQRQCRSDARGGVSANELGAEARDNHAHGSAHGCPDRGSAEAHPQAHGGSADQAARAEPDAGANDVPHVHSAGRRLALMAPVAEGSFALCASERPAYRAWPAVTSIRSVPPDMVGCGFGVFGTFGALLVTRQASLAAAKRVLAAELRAIDHACSRFRADSELTALNQADGSERAISPLFAEAIAVALRAAEASAGDVDPTCGQSLVSLGYDRDFTELAGCEYAPVQPPAPAAGWRCVRLDAEEGTVRVPAGVQLDLGATAKALAADRAASAIAVATGGWRVQVADDLPDRSARAARAVRRPGPVIAIWDGGLATSGAGSRRWRRGGKDLHHIVNPGTGCPASSCWASVSVAAASCVDANTASTAAIIRSVAAVRWLTDLAMPARLVRPDGTVVTTGGWPDEL